MSHPFRRVEEVMPNEPQELTVRVLAVFPDESLVWGIGDSKSEARTAAIELRRRDEAPPDGWQQWEDKLAFVVIAGPAWAVESVINDLRSAEALVVSSRDGEK